MTTPEEVQRLIGEIGTLRTECEELRLRNEILQYDADRKGRQVRELERELQEWRTLYRFANGNKPLVTHAGKGFYHDSH